MTGLDKIVQEIQDEANAEARAAIDKAKAEAAEILADAKARGASAASEAASAAGQQVKDIAAAQDSAMQLQRRQKTLEVKQQLLAETLEKALQALYNLPDKEYFGLLTRLAVRAAQPGEGEILLNKRDLERLPIGFELDVAAALTPGKKIRISQRPRPIDGGFIFKYGNVEENCSFRALFDARQDEFSDLIRDTLFA